jgi:xylulokinase
MRLPADGRRDPDALTIVVDQGSTTTKVGLVDARWQIADRAFRHTKIDFPARGAIESDPRSWWAAVSECVAELGSRQDLSAVRAVAACGFMHSLVPVNADGRPLAKAILSSDQRMLAADGPPPVSAAEAALARMAAWATREPDLARQVAALLTVKDYLRLQMTGALATDAYDAAGCGIVEADTGMVRPDALARLGVPLGAVPTVREATEVAGGLLPEVARRWGVPSGTPVVVGTGDWMAALVGADAALPRRACIYLGTSGAVGAFDSRVDLRALVRPRCFAVASSTGSALDWAATLLFPASASASAALLAAAESAPIGARGVRFLPHLAERPGAGRHPGASGSILGLSLASGRADVARAVVEGITFWLWTLSASALGRAAPGQVVLAGGGSRSRFWAQMVCDVFEMPLTVSAEPDVGLLGGALIASRVTGADPRAADPGRRESTCTPDPAMASRYRELRVSFERTEVRPADLGSFAD